MITACQDCGLSPASCLPVAVIQSRCSNLPSSIVYQFNHKISWKSWNVQLWLLSALQNVTFYLRNKSVQGGEMKVNLSCKSVKLLSGAVPYLPAETWVPDKQEMQVEALPPSKASSLAGDAWCQQRVRDLTLNRNRAELPLRSSQLCFHPAVSCVSRETPWLFSSFLLCFFSSFVLSVCTYHGTDTVLSCVERRGAIPWPNNSSFLTSIQIFEVWFQYPSSFLESFP